MKRRKFIKATAERRQMTVDGETFTLIFGNLHEHSNSSHCWHAGTDGTLHEDYRFGMFSEGYDFVGMPTMPPVPVKYIGGEISD